MTPSRPPLAVTQLEDRTQPAIVGSLQSNLLAAILLPAYTQTAPPVHSPWAVHVGSGAVGIMGLTRNRNETFVRRKGKR